MGKIEETIKWLKFAAEDLKAAKSFLSKDELMPRHSCWLAQQSAEKSLKAVLCHENIRIPKTHDLEFLLTLVPDNWNLKNLNLDLAVLSEWAVEARYPGDWDDASETDAINAVKIASVLFDETNYKLQSIEKADCKNIKIEIVKDDITKLKVDAIVNAANKTLLGGGGVDGAIHRAAGKKLLDECKKLNGCETGQAKITKGYNLPAKFVIHTVGPVWSGGKRNEPELLANCYRNSLKLAAENGIKTIAFPAISCGVYRFPKEEAAEIALKEINKFMEQNKLPEKIIIVCFDDEMYEIYKNLLK